MSDKWLTRDELAAWVRLVALLAAAMWGGVIPSPFSRPFSSPEPTEAAAPRVPCPPPDALPQPFSEISANVLNSTDQSGLAASTAGGLAQHGVQISQQSNYGGDIDGPATIVSGPRGLRAAYTVAQLIPGSTVSLDGRDDAVIDVILGGSFDQVLDPETAGFDAEAPLTPPPGCSPVPEPTEEDSEEWTVVLKLLKEGEAADDDAAPGLVAEHPWLASYQAAGRRALSRRV